METVMITGGTGMIGKALTRALLEKNYRVIILSRQQISQGEKPNLSYAMWDVEKQQIDNKAVASANHIIHLAGENIAARRWTKKRKQQIADSRIKGGELIVKALQANPNKVRTVVSASAIGWYGSDPNIPNTHSFTENDLPADNFLGETCKRWEQSLQPVTAMGKRFVRFRTGIVLSRKGGALEEFRKPIRFGIATILGSGRQVISWIHIDDLVRLYIRSIEDPNLEGPYNAVAPLPVTNKGLVIQLARKKRGNFFIPIYVPSFVLRLVLGEMAIEVLKSATVSSARLKEAGFVFQFPSVTAAINNLES